MEIYSQMNEAFNVMLCCAVRGIYFSDFSTGKDLRDVTGLWKFYNSIQAIRTFMLSQNHGKESHKN